MSTRATYEGQVGQLRSLGVGRWDGCSIPRGGKEEERLEEWRYESPMYGLD